MIRVTFHSDGLIESVHLDPRVKRLAVDELAESLVAAVRAVQTELLRQAETAIEARRASDQSLDEKLKVVYDEYIRQTAEFQHLGNEILKQLKE